MLLFLCHIGYKIFNFLYISTQSGINLPCKYPVKSSILKIIVKKIKKIVDN